MAWNVLVVVPRRELEMSAAGREEPAAEPTVPR
jgi:hypothetical protein